MKRLFLQISFFLILFLPNSSNAFVIYDDTRLWKSNVITFYFLDGTRQQRHEVEEYTKIWQRYSGIKFNFVTREPSFKISKFYKITFKGDSNDSHRGQINGLVRLGQLSEDVIYRKKTILHEFGHVLGLGHEHQRPDRSPILNQPKIADHCSTHQKKSVAWCVDNVLETYTENVMVSSKYDAESIMHYRIQDILGPGIEKVDTNGLIEPPNSLSLVDKLYIAQVYNPSLSKETIENMHQQDVWYQKQFEVEANYKKEKEMERLKTGSCKTLKYGNHSKDGRSCSNGFMIIGADGFSFHHPELQSCYLYLKELRDTINTHQVCQLNQYQLNSLRNEWNGDFSRHGQCKILNTGEKNNQDYFCEDGYSFVTKDNDMVEDKTRCMFSHDQVYKAMKSNEICNFNQEEYDLFNLILAEKIQQQMITTNCQVVNKSYKTLTCPEDFNYTIINRSLPDKPINNKCFANEHQAIRAMNDINFCISP